MFRDGHIRWTVPRYPLLDWRAMVPALVLMTSEDLQPPEHREEQDQYSSAEETAEQRIRSLMQSSVCGKFVVYTGQDWRALLMFLGHVEVHASSASPESLRRIYIHIRIMSAPCHD